MKVHVRSYRTLFRIEALSSSLADGRTRLLPTRRRCREKSEVAQGVLAGAAVAGRTQSVPHSQETATVGFGDGELSGELFVPRLHGSRGT